jgi:hypothetical protein
MRRSKNPKLKKFADYISSEEQEMKLHLGEAAGNKFKYIDATVMHPSRYNEKEKEKLRRKALPRTVQAERRAAGSALKGKINATLPRWEMQMTDAPYGEYTFAPTYVNPNP